MNNRIRKIIWISIAAFCIFFAAGMLTYTTSKEYSQDARNWWIAKNPNQPDKPFILYRGRDGYKASFNLLWGLEGLRAINPIGPPALVALLLVAIYLSGFAAQKANRFLSGNIKGKPNWTDILGQMILWVFAAIFFSLFILFPIPFEINRTFGDATALPRHVEQGILITSEVLTYRAYFLAAKLTSPVNGHLAIVYIAYFSGAVFIAGMALFALGIGRNWAERLSFFILSIMAGYSVQFFGYIETTTLELGFMAAYFGAAIKYVYSGTDREKYSWLAAAMAGLSIAMMAHAAGILLLPSLAILIITKELEKISFASLLKLMRQPKILTIFFILIVLPYLLVIVIPFYAKGNFGYVMGGDEIAFVPLHSIDYSHRPAAHVYYDMFSFWHASDILSAFIVGAPAVMILIPAALAFLAFCKPALSSSEKSIVWFLGASALTCALVPIFWNHDFGMWGDWNLATTYIFPLNLFSWSTFLIVSRKFLSSSELYYRAFLPLLTIQIIGALGILLQFYYI